MNTVMHEWMGSLSGEMAEVEYGDLRLERRLPKVIEAASERPGASFPAMFRGDASALEALYRFVNNERVNPAATLKPHVQATKARAASLNTVIVAHDSSDFACKRERPPSGLGHLKGRKEPGFVGHVSLAIDPERGGLPLGVVAFESLNRTGPRKGRRSSKLRRADPDRESLRWLRGVTEASSQLDHVARVIHVMDREADFFELFSHVISEGDDFVIRIQHDREVDIEEKGKGEGETIPTTLFDALPKLDALLRREVELSRRGKAKTPSQKKNTPARQTRVAKLEIAAGPVTVKRPKSAPAMWPKQHKLFAVHVRERNPPKGLRPIEWKLLTTLPVTTASQAAFAVDSYRYRWPIEEYFKALKTGCAFRKRHFDSAHALLNVLAISMPVAWRLLVLRDFGRQHPSLPATAALTETEITVLKHFSSTKLSRRPTLGEAMAAVAGLGGHLKRNGPPGWITLNRGLELLQTLTEGWCAGQKLKK